MNHEMTQWKFFVPVTPFCDHIWSHVELFSKIQHNKALVSIIIVMDTWLLEKLVMVWNKTYPLKNWIVFTCVWSKDAYSKWKQNENVTRKWYEYLEWKRQCERHLFIPTFQLRQDYRSVWTNPKSLVLFLLSDWQIQKSFWESSLV